jgi:hypothetical protein
VEVEVQPSQTPRVLPITAKPVDLLEPVEEPTVVPPTRAVPVIHHLLLHLREITVEMVP